MPMHAEKKYLPFTPRQLYDLVADVDRYREFLPWCAGSRVRKREGNVFYGDLMVGFKMVRERFTSKVTLGDGRIDIEYVEGPFRYLNNHWIFEPAEDGGTIINFCVDFEVRSRMLQPIIGTVFNEAVKVMVSSFERRARQLYGADGRLVGHPT
jgi:coenzyme Q-binding protein COQ10